MDIIKTALGSSALGNWLLLCTRELLLWYMYLFLHTIYTITLSNRSIFNSVITRKLSVDQRNSSKSSAVIETEWPCLNYVLLLPMMNNIPSIKYYYLYGWFVMCNRIAPNWLQHFRFWTEKKELHRQINWQRYILFGTGSFFIYHFFPIFNIWKQCQR